MRFREGASPVLFLNDNILSHSTQRGVARYFRKVADGIGARHGGDVVIYSPDRREYGRVRHIAPPRPMEEWPDTIVRRAVISLCYRMRRPRFLRDAAGAWHAWMSRASVVFSPYYGNLRTRAKEVFAVHDMIHELNPGYFPVANDDFREFMEEKKRCIRRADRLIAVSQSTARDICRVYGGTDAGKIVVIPHGVDVAFFAAGRVVEPEGCRPYFLYVGSRWRYKNFARLLMAYGQSGVAREFDLRVISPDAFDAEEERCIAVHGLRGRVRLIRDAGEEELRASYRGCVGFVYPSEYEGFGLPILEAMASGAVVATGNVSSMPEVGGDAALYFDPLRVESIGECLSKLAGMGAEERRARGAEGARRAREFTWERCQEATLQALLEVASGS